MKVAFATKDLVNIDEHFGWAKQFAVYNITKDGSTLDRVVTTEETPENEDDKINSKIDLVRGCAIVYCQAIGPTAAARVVKAQIHPIKVEKVTPIEEAVASLVKMLGGNPPPWIRRIVAREEGLEA
ncbi:MAG: nitrogen fixation protein NifX [Campylobacterales bacterium]|nr:nitrogen fixation protein NifX [Campylobacterales bacterium]